MDRLKSEKISRSILYHSCLRNKMPYTHPFCVRPALSWMYLINLDSLTHCGPGRQNLMCGKLLLPGSCLFNFMNLRGGVQVSCLNAHFWALSPNSDSCYLTSCDLRSYLMVEPQALICRPLPLFYLTTVPMQVPRCELLNNCSSWNKNLLVLRLLSCLTGNSHVAFVLRKKCGSFPGGYVLPR